MIELKGTYGKARIFTDRIEKECIRQIKELLEQDWTRESKIRIMPDCHAGKGCTIGTTITITDKIVPNLVGVDIGCGMTMAKLGKREIKFELLDTFIHNAIPAGFNIHSHAQPYSPINQLKCLEFVNRDRALKSIGTLGGGNHFIEVNKDDEDQIYLVVHSGSRHLGKQIADFYQKLAYTTLIKHQRKAAKNVIIKKDLSYLKGQDFQDYIQDMEIAQKYASVNRLSILHQILNNFFNIPMETNEITETIHNYIDTTHFILRKGAISAQKGEKVLIPMNMRDGSLICVGKGNRDWNFSAPHGAGRLMSRTEAKKRLNLMEFKESMSGIFTTSVKKSTLDEAPMVYKPMAEILTNIRDTVEVKKIIKPLYNFKG
jgi:RNA-splicing ligase RtcB